MITYISADELVKELSKISLSNHGTLLEKEYVDFLTKRFPNYEIYWRYFVVPATTVIENVDSGGALRTRQCVSDQVTDICSLHNSVFLNLLYSHLHLMEYNAPSSFEDFYMHLVAASDVAEAFLFRIYILIMTSIGDENQDFLKRMNLDHFLKQAEKWFKKKYTKSFNIFTNTGHFRFMNPPHDAKSILGKYYQKSQCWSEYMNYTMNALRPYRNTVVHNALIRYMQDAIIDIGKGEAKEIRYVPKIENICKYNSLSKFQRALYEYNQTRSDFTVMEEQMKSDIQKVMKLMNELWEKPINDLYALLYKESNEHLQNEFNISFSK